MCREGDPPILASARTSCSLAGNYLDTWFHEEWWELESLEAKVYWPVTHRWYRITGTVHGRFVTATGPYGIWFRFANEP
jgi:hypothetical protein